MPLINGMKMACEPCIRGHRSTKCTHANERLMVPVRKPGRPLSACPHLRDQICGCNSVTAAIPRKQTCQCGGSTSPVNGVTALSRAIPSSTDAPLSPSKATFRINKNNRKPTTNRKSSHNMSLDMINADQMNIHPKPVTGHLKPAHLSNGSFVSQLIDNQTQCFHMHEHNCTAEETINRHNLNANEISAGFSSSTSELTQCSNNSGSVASYLPRGTCDTKVSSNDAVICCCCLKNIHRTRTNSSVKLSCPKIKTIPENVVNLALKSSRCPMKHQDHHDILNLDQSIKTNQPEINNGRLREVSLPLSQNSTTPIGAQILSHNGIDYTNQFTHFYPYPSTEIPSFSYPAYGSFSNPLEASVWRQNQENMFSQPQEISQALSMGNSPSAFGVIGLNHTCNCGDTCQCVGCASHPYNDATQDYVLSAWQSISMENDSNDCYTNENSNSNENESASLQQIVETRNSSNPLTPSSLSGNDEEQNLPENDFFFVNYPIPSEGCQDSTLGFICNETSQHREHKTHKRNPG